MLYVFNEYEYFYILCDFYRANPDNEDVVLYAMFCLG